MIENPTAETLERERRHHRNLLNAVNGIVWEADAATFRFTFVSDKAEEIVGYPARRWVEEPTFWIDHLHPDDRDWAMRFCIDNAAARQDHELDYRMLRPDGGIVWLRETVTIDVQPDDTVKLRGVIVDITRQKTIERELARRDAILEAVRFAGERLLAPTESWDASVNAVLQRLGEASDASRVYIFENYTGPDGEILATNTHEWVDAPERSVIARPQLQALSYRDLGLEGWLEAMPRGEVVHAHVRDLPDPPRAEFEDEGTRSFAVVPIFVGGQWWGFIGFDDCVEERELSGPERDALMAAAGMIGAALGREQELARRDAALEAVRYAGERFLTDPDAWETSLDEVLARLGEATGVSRVYLFRNELRPDGDLVAWNTHEWAIAPEYAVMHLPQLQPMSYAGIGFGRWVDILRRGEEVYGHTEDFPPEERRALEAQRVRSVALVPVFVDGAWWGFIGFDECIRRRRTSAMEREVLRAAAETLGAAIGRNHADAELRESQRSMQTLLANLPGMAYRIPVDHRERAVRPGVPPDLVSEGALELTGYRPEQLTGTGGFSYVDIIDPEHRAAMAEDIAAAIAAVAPYHLTYRITTADGGRKWVMEQGRPIADETGTVLALEGIITDVTERVEARRELERRVTERTRELATLLEIARNLTATVDLEPLLGQILDELRAAVDYHGAGILILRDGVLVQAARRGPENHDGADDVRVVLAASRPLRAMIERGVPSVIGDVWGDDDAARSYRRTMTDAWLRERPYIRSWAGVPLQSRNRTLGLMVISYAEPNHFTERHVEMLTAVAAQAAVAIENARLFEEAQGTAALEERQRLARELHDSVSQALFGIGLGARTARTLIEQDPAKAIAPLDYVLSLAEAGLAEMRALIFELRPEALEQEGLVAALQKQVASLRARYGIAVEASLPATVAIAPAAQEAIYRIAQEALHNIVKHARATTVTVTVEAGDAETTLRVRDDGVGFDTGGSFPGHLGLRTMRERAEKLGGTFRLESAPGAGSTIEVRVPATPPPIHP